MGKNRQLLRESGFLLMAFFMLAVLSGTGAGILTVQAAEKVFVDKSPNPVALVHIVNGSGEEMRTLNESRMATGDGKDVFCLDPYEEFEAGEKTMKDATDRFSYEQIEDLALHVEYVKQYAKKYNLSSPEAYMMQQILVWRRLSAFEGIQAERTYADANFLKLTVQKQIFEGADQFYKENKGKYICSGSVMIGNGQDTAMFKAEPKPGKASLLKESANEGLTQGNGCYKLEGAVYVVYADKDCTTKKGELTLLANGTSNELELAEGTYYVKEMVSPTGYLTNPKVYPVEVKKAETTTLKVQDVPGFALPLLVLEKVDAETDLSLPQGGASLAGAQFEVCYYDGYYGKDALPKTSVRTWVLQTLEEETDDGSVLCQAAFTEEHKVDGDDFYRHEGKIVLPLGTISVREIRPPEGYLLNEDFSFVTQITMEDQTVMITDELTWPIAENPVRGGVRIRKLDRETGKDHSQGDASLAGAVFEITNENPCPVVVEDILYEPGAVVLTLTADETGLAETSPDLLPYGSYRITEVEAPEGYLLSGILERKFDIAKPGMLVDLTDPDTGILDQVIRGDLEGVKIAEKTHKRLAHVPFLLTSVTTGESHTIVTDENGQFSTAASFTPHTKNTNQGQSCEDGVWFGGGEPDDEKGALPYDTYQVEEQACKANEGFDLIPPFRIKISKDSMVVHLGTLTDTAPEIEEEIPETPEQAKEVPVLTSPNPAPRTGDSAAPLFWGILALISLAAAGTCVVRFICGKMNHK